MGPVSQQLEQELRREVQRNGIVVWLDRDDHYSALVDSLIEQARERSLPYDVFGFRGSFLELMLALEPQMGSIDKPQLVIHLPAFNEGRIRKISASLKISVLFFG